MLYSNFSKALDCVRRKIYFLFFVDYIFMTWTIDYFSGLLIYF